MAKRSPPVPLYESPPGKPWCGPTVAKMVLECHGKHISIAEIARRTSASGGVWIPAMGLLFIRLGLNVTIYGWNNTFPSRFMDVADDKIKEQLIQWSRRRKNIKARGLRSNRLAFYRYLINGGNFSPRIYEGFSIRKLQAALQRNEPPIINVMAAPMWGEWDRVRNVEHYVVLTKITSKISVIHDPAYGRVELPTDLLRFACFNAAESSVMYIGRK